MAIDGEKWTNKLTDKIRLEQGTFSGNSYIQIEIYTFHDIIWIIIYNKIPKIAPSHPIPRPISFSSEYLQIPDKGFINLVYTVSYTIFPDW